MSRGSSLAERFADHVQRVGEQLTVTRPRTATSQSLWFTVLPLGIDDINSLTIEGIDNVNDPEPHLFVAPLGSDVKDGDRITYNGSTYRVHSAIPRRVSGVATSINCVALKEGPA